MGARHSSGAHDCATGVARSNDYERSRMSENFIFGLFSAT